MPRVPEIVRIWWIDAQHPRGDWVAPDDLKGPLPVIKSVGFLVHEDRRKVVLASSWDGHHVSGEVTIPRVAIRKRKAAMR